MRQECNSKKGNVNYPGVAVQGLIIMGYCKIVVNYLGVLFSYAKKKTSHVII